MDPIFKQVVVREAIIAALFSELERRTGAPFNLIVDADAFEQGCNAIAKAEDWPTTMTHDKETGQHTVTLVSTSQNTDA